MAFLNNVYLVDSIQITGDKLDQVKVTTILNSLQTNIYAKVRLSFFEKQLKTEYTFKISECSYDEKNDPTSNLARLQLGSMKFFCHRSRTLMINEELLTAVLHPKVH